jgi:hypothetical protein
MANPTETNDTPTESHNEQDTSSQQSTSKSRKCRPRSRINFSFGNSSMNSNSSAQSSDLVDSLSADMIEMELNNEEPTMNHVRTSSQGSVTSTESQRSNSALLRLFVPQKEEHPQKRPQTFRGYGVGDYVLISNHGLEGDSLKLVNAMGFAEWDTGMALTSEEESGPYEYLLAVVKTVHFTENLPFYTVTRMDSGEDQRADIGEFWWIEKPLIGCL